MPRTTRNVLGAVAIALIACALPSGRARAGIVLGTATVRQGGDPFYIYTIEVLLDPHNTMMPASSGSFFTPIHPTTDSFLTIYNLAGYSAYNGTFADAGLTSPELEFSVVPRDAGSGYTPAGVTPPAPVADAADVTFYELKGHDPIVNSGVAPLLLGYLVLQTFLPDGVPPTLDLDYSSQATDNTTGLLSIRTGTVHATLVPEPASLACLILGGSVVLMAVRRRARRGQATRDL